MSKIIPLDNPFWQFSLRFYSDPIIEQQCLDLQGQGFQVNLLLFCLWHGNAGRGVLLTPRLLQLQQLLLPSQQVIEPLRLSRQRLKSLRDPHQQPYLDQLRQQLKHAELAAEQYQQYLLYQQADQVKKLCQPKADALFNLNTYAQMLARTGFDEAHPLLQSLSK